MRKPSLARNWLILLVSLGIILMVSRSILGFLVSPINPADTTKRSFVIQKGEATANIANRLQSQGFIRSSLAFNVLIQTSGMVGTIQAGNFLLSPSMSSQVILDTLGNGVTDKWVTLIEGWRVEEMAERLQSELGINKQEFIKQAALKEGYLFPDSYLFHKDVSVGDIILKMENNFTQQVSLGIEEKFKKLGLTKSEAIILASIVEREARSDEVRRMVASILLKRLSIGMALQTDATVQYALGYQEAEKGWWKSHLTRDDLEIESPFNTYLHPGLPPAPISNPSLSSLQAVANADPKIPYLFYFHNGQGNSYYGRTLEEHNLNVASYR